MSTTTQLFGRLGTVAGATAVTVGLSAALAAAPASAVPQPLAVQPPATLQITGIGYDQYRVTVTGVFPMSRAAALGHLENAGGAGGMRYVLHGAEPSDRRDDTQYVSSIAGPTTDTVSSSLQGTTDGLRYLRSFVVDRSVLDEDGGLDVDDEIYVRAEFLDGRGGSRQATSDVLRAQF